MTSPTPDIMASPTRKRPRTEESPYSVKKFVLNPPKRRITKLSNHPQLQIPKFVLSTSTCNDPTPPGPTHPGSLSHDSSTGISPPSLTHPPSQINSSTNTPKKCLPINYNSYAGTPTSYDPLHQSPWHEFKYAKRNPTEPSSILYFEKQRQIACKEAGDRARIAQKECVETKVATATAAPRPIALPHLIKTRAHVQKATTPAPARRIHDPYLFMSERKPTGNAPAKQVFTFEGNHSGARSYSPFVFNPVIPRHSTPVRARGIGDASAAISAATLAQTPEQKESRMANFTATAVAGAARFYVEADSIVNSLAKSYSLAKAALVGNRDSKTAERRASQKMAIRKKIEEEERVRRKELFEEFEEFEAQAERRNREVVECPNVSRDINDGRATGVITGDGPRMVTNRDTELPTERDLVSGANTSFVTEDTILDTVDYNPNGFHATIITESVQVSGAAVMSSSPVVRVDIQSEQSSPTPNSVVYTNVSIAAVDTYEGSSTSSASSDEDSDGMEIIEPKPKQAQQIISLDSDDEVEEIASTPRCVFPKYFIFESNII